MKITLENLSKKYHREWIFKNINLELNSGASSYVITGSNGSGKSTLLQIISGTIMQSNGNIKYHNSDDIPIDKIHNYISFASPYLELIEEFTLLEFLKFHFKFKPILNGLELDDIIEMSFLNTSKNKYIKNFSSGMKQRLKLALCFYADTPITLLDEPTSNLDQKGVRWYQDNIAGIIDQKLVIIASNQDNEYLHCKNIIDINTYKV